VALWSAADIPLPEKVKIPNRNRYKMQETNMHLWLVLVELWGIEIM